MLQLSAATREANLALMADRTFDVAVIGGGITGAGVALDAASRGLSVALVEREDFASGTSGRSSRLIHGGPRYLRQGELGLVYESLRERETLRRLAPHLVRPLGFMVSLRRRRDRLAMGIGLTLYDALTVWRNIARHRRIGAEEVSRLAPSLARPAPGHLYFDCRTDDARLVVEVVRQAAARGAMVANHAEAEGLLGQGTVRGVLVHDRVGGGRVEVRARAVVNATGAWAAQVQGLAVARPPRLRPSKGVHLVFDRERLPVRTAVLVPSVEGRGAMVFVVPWGPRVYAGTTDTPHGGPLEEPPVDASDRAVVLDSLGRAFAGDLVEPDVLGSWAGVRPLLDTGTGSTRDLSRRHVILEDPPGLLTVTGGKLTTYRLMAEQVVDRVSAALGSGGRCTTRRLPLGLTRPLAQELERAAESGKAAGLSPDGARRLVLRFGDDWEDAVARIREDPAMGEEAVPGLPVLGVELELARTRDMAITDDDVLVRRTRLATMGAVATNVEAVPDGGSA